MFVLGRNGERKYLIRLSVSLAEAVDKEIFSFISLIMNQKAFQSGPDKGINDPLDLFPITAVVAEHQFIDSQAAVHLEIEDSLRLFKGEEAVGHKPGDVVFLMVGHLINDSDRNGVIQKKRTESIITVNPVAKGVGAVGGGASV